MNAISEFLQGEPRLRDNLMNITSQGMFMPKSISVIAIAAEDDWTIIVTNAVVVI